MSNDIKVAILQPIIPHYRVDFFDNLYRCGDYIVFYSSEDFSGLKSSDESDNRDYAHKVGRFVKLPFISAYWQLGVLNRCLFSFDVIVISGNPRVINHMIIFLLCKLFRKPVVWWGQGWTANKRGVLAKFRRYMMKFADAIVLYTSKEAGELAGHAKVVGLDNGIDIKPINIVLSQAKFDADSNGDTLKLVFIGRLTYKTNLMWLLESLKVVNRKLSLTIIGEGPLLNELKVVAQEMPNNVEIIFEGAVFEPEKLASIFCSSDAFVYPGAVGLSLIHAFAHGLPALLPGDSSGHMPEYSAFREGYNGFTLPNSANKVGVFLDNLSVLTLKGMRANAKSTVTHSFNTDVMAERFDGLIKGLFDE
ncbi:TPA: glycosyltransferase family 4 protein [Vibrio parahaemolyticus]|uniref:KanE n=1 Tax=Vibrio parahaemolyticus TaxID=670 RepID=A0A5P4S718_VIBPH|nr:glycosyltransferase family 4 protein [Vibrio parahaemolyticus]EJG0632086.1 glycosyltransferase family 4 protein [Vibrio parahaemolyticus]EJG0737716.1 glycosyltransferase family 4 protein [Vibrio parahaemolyticus]EJG0916184.1 glycosyltransferase family 4 protein [Vibrio parahaemolyticus]ELY3407848.1 glycosyltransferase family 4 protein [Vibrio parahaemolyticus]MDF4704747.1 glycosyltransferase family 4 protein [Vibrio parahaemolyticus]